MDEVIHIRNVEPRAGKRFRVLVAELGLSQAETLAWLLLEAHVLNADDSTPAAVIGVNFYRAPSA